MQARGHRQRREGLALTRVTVQRIVRPSSLHRSPTSATPPWVDTAKDEQSLRPHRTSFSAGIHTQRRDAIETVDGYADLYNSGSPGVAFVGVDTEVGSMRTVE